MAALFSLFSLDYITIFSRTPHEHIEHVPYLLTLLKDAGVELNLKKCENFSNSNDYLGHAFSQGVPSCQHRQLTQCSDLNTQPASQRSDHFLVCVTYFGVLYLALPSLSTHAIRSGRKVNCRPLTGYPVKKSPPSSR